MKVHCGRYGGTIRCWPAELQPRRLSVRDNIITFVPAPFRVELEPMWRRRRPTGGDRLSFRARLTFRPPVSLGKHYIETVWGCGYVLLDPDPRLSR
jgi:hypothetical protein